MQPDCFGIPIKGGCFDMILQRDLLCVVSFSSNVTISSSKACRKSGIGVEDKPTTKKHLSSASKGFRYMMGRGKTDNRFKGGGWHVGSNQVSFRLL